MKTISRALLFVLILSGACSSAWATLQLPSVFGDHMVLQRDQEIPVWGKADAGQAVTVQLLEVDNPRPLAQGFTQADAQGRWRIDLQEQPAGGPYRLVVRGGDVVTLDDVYLGEVWLCSGQSNMEWPVRLSNNADAEAMAADDPLIRHFDVPRTISPLPLDDTESVWTVASPSTVPHYTAVGYFFARELRNKLGVPVGLINSTWGGTRIEPWMPPHSLAEYPELLAEAEAAAEKARSFTGSVEEAATEVEREQEAYTRAVAERRRRVIEGGTGLADGWAEPGLDVSDWTNMAVPGNWEDSGIEEFDAFDGVVWYRRTFDIPASWVGRDLVLELGGIDDIDTTYVNGTEVGKTGFDAGDHWRKPRVYQVPGTLITGLRVTLAIRVGDWYYAGGFNGTARDILVRLAEPRPGSQETVVRLAGVWKAKIDAAGVAGPMPPAPASAALGDATNRTPTALYHGMIQPVLPYGIRGAIWYQGESNASEAERYRDLMPGLINAWRADWGDEAMPFGIVQLANFMEVRTDPRESAWAELRDAQLNTAKTMDNVGLAVIIDIGEADDIHPRNKQDVGSRLARWAMADAYGQEGVGWSGPMFDRAFFVDNKVIVTFDLFGSRLATRDGSAPAGFAVQDEMGTWHWAEARIEGDRVEVWCDEVPSPVAIRYAWADNPVSANLVNTEKLPASPFEASMPESE
ncbi:MAG: sialate O-acetylesterase [Phycisphaeraceae bacterium]